MKIMSRITWASMKANKLRTIVTIIGIILSATMFTAVTTFCSSLLNFMKESYIYSEGNYHVGMYQIDAATLNDMKSDSRFGLSCSSEVLGYAEIPSKNEDKPYMYVQGIDQSFIDQMSLHLAQGRFAENDSEIVLSTHIVTNGKVNIRLGDSITLEIGKRMLAENELNQRVEFTSKDDSEEIGLEERIEVLFKKTYTVVGFIERPALEEYSAPGYSAFTVKTGSNDAATAATYNFYSLVNNPRSNYVAVEDEYTIQKVNNSMLMVSAYMGFDNLNSILYGFVSILVVLIIIGSVSLIYSAFSISVSERTRQFGLLSSIGATRKQIRFSVLYEALMYSAIGIPIGLAAGAVGIGTTLFLCRDLFNSISNVHGSVSIRLHVSVYSIIVATAIALVTVIISAWIPSIRAMRITPLEAIRQSRDIKFAKSRIRYSKLFVKVFGASGVLAKKYYSRSKKKYKATIIALAFSIMLFISASSFCMYLTKAVNFNASVTDADIRIELLYSDYKIVCDQIRNLPGIKKVIAGRSADELKCAVNKETLTDGFVKYHSVDNYGSCDLTLIYIPVHYIEDDVFREILAENGLNEADFFGNEPKQLVLNQCKVTDYIKEDGKSNRVVRSYNAFNQNVKEIYRIHESEVPDGYEYWMTAPNDEGVLTAYFIPDNDGECSFDEIGRPIAQPTKQVEYDALEIGGLIEDAPLGVPDQMGVMMMIRPISAMENYTEEKLSIAVKCEDPYASVEAIKRVINDNGLLCTDSTIHNYAESERSVRNIILLTKIFSYGFTTLISLISIANVFNTIATNVALRRRDYAMLRSMGMSQRDMKRMTNYECLTYGTRAVLIGIPLAAMFSYLVYRIDAADMKFTLPWTAVGIAILSLFLVVFASMMYSTGKLDNDNPVEVLKNENI